MKKQVLLLIVTLLTSVLTFAAPTLSDNEAKRWIVSVKSTPPYKSFA